MRLKSLPLGLPDRGDETGAAAVAVGDASGAGAAPEGGEGMGGAVMRLRSLPFPFGGDIVASCSRPRQVAMCVFMLK